MVRKIFASNFMSHAWLWITLHITHKKFCHMKTHSYICMKLWERSPDWTWNRLVWSSFRTLLSCLCNFWKYLMWITLRSMIYRLIELISDCCGPNHWPKLMKIIQFINFIQKYASLANNCVNQSIMLSVDGFYLKKYTDLTICVNFMNEWAENWV